MPLGVQRKRMPRLASTSGFSSVCAKYFDMDCWFSLRTLTPKRFLALTRGSSLACSATQTRRSSGSRETEVTELAVMPWTWPGARSAVTTVTPVANCEQAKRNSVAVGGVDAMMEVFDDIIEDGAK